MVRLVVSHSLVLRHHAHESHDERLCAVRAAGYPALVPVFLTFNFSQSPARLAVPEGRELRRRFLVLETGNQVLPQAVAETPVCLRLLVDELSCIDRTPASVESIAGKTVPIGSAPWLTNPHISQTERTELKTSTRISFPQPVVGRRS